MSLAILKKKLADRFDHTHGMVGIYTSVQDRCVVVLTNKMPDNIKEEIRRIAGKDKIDFKETGPIRKQGLVQRE